MCYHYIFIRIANIRIATPNLGKDAEKMIFLMLLVGMYKGYSHSGRVWMFIIRLITHSPCNDTVKKKKKPVSKGYILYDSISLTSSSK